MKTFEEYLQERTFVPPKGMLPGRAKFAVGQKQSTGAENLPKSSKDEIFVLGIHDMLVEDGILRLGQALSELGKKDFAELLDKRHTPTLLAIYNIVKTKVAGHDEELADRITKLITDRINAIYGSNTYRMK